MSPILVRPVREQLEHDRVIRLLQARLKRRHDVTINVADDQTAGVKVGVGQMFPDLLLTSLDRGGRLEGIVEVETGESVNHLEAMAQWAHFGRIRIPFHLYIPASAVEIARRLCTENQVNVAEIWSFHTIGDQTRFTLVQRSAQETRRGEDARKRAEARTPAAPRPAAARTPRKAARPARKVAPAARGAKAPASRTKPAPSRKTATARTQTATTRTQKRK